MTLTRCPILLDSGPFLIVSKPEGVLSHPNIHRHQTQTNTRCAFEGKYDFEKRCFASPEGPIWLIHRLDQDTSGILVACRDQKMTQTLLTLFEEGKITKIYSALAISQVRPKSATWRDHLMVDRNQSRVRSRVIPHRPINATLDYEVERYFPFYRLSLLRIRLITGKSHQIRVQAAYRGYPICGDEIYGNFPLNKKLRREIGLRRLFLHATGMEIPLPDRTLCIEDPLPEPCLSVLKKLS